MTVEVHWRGMTGPRDVAWGWSGVLYAYLHPNLEHVLYIGLAYGRTVRERWAYTAKSHTWDCIQKRGTGLHICLVGQFALEPGRRRTRQLVSDVESLLIKNIQPCCNKASRKTRIERPGLHVRCRGGWNGWHAKYSDV